VAGTGQRFADALALRSRTGYAKRRLAILDGDADALVAMLGGDLSSADQFIGVAEAMGREDEVLTQAQWGIAEATG
jgi:hypothetical protein